MSLSICHVPPSDICRNLAACVGVCHIKNIDHRLIYWLLCFEQVSNKHIHLLNKGSFGGRCISFPSFIIHRCIISGGKLIHQSLISGGKLISPPVDIRCYFYIRLNKKVSTLCNGSDVPQK